MKRTVALTALTALTMMTAVGCGQPQYPATPENSIVAKRTAFGAEIGLRNAADTNFEIRDSHFNPETRDLQIGFARFESAQSANQRELIQWMLAFQGQQREYANIRAAEWTGFNQFAGTVAGVAGPALQTYLTGRSINQGLKTLRPNIIEDFALLQASGSLSDPEGIIQQLERDFGPGIRAEIAARLASLAASATAAASRPAASPAAAPSNLSKLIDSP